MLKARVWRVIERKAAFRFVQISFSLLKPQPKFQHRNFANVIDENEPTTARKVWDGTLVLKDRPFVAKRTFEGMPQKTKPLPPQGEACLYLCFCCVCERESVYDCVSHSLAPSVSPALSLSLFLSPAQFST
jgi:hypothetical protein